MPADRRLLATSNMMTKVRNETVQLLLQIVNVHTLVFICMHSDQLLYCVLQMCWLWSVP